MFILSALFWNKYYTLCCGVYNVLICAAVTLISADELEDVSFKHALENRAKETQICYTNISFWMNKQR